MCHTLVARLMEIVQDSRFDKTVIMPVYRPTDSNRNHIANFFLSHPFDFLIMIDDDNPPVHNPLDLILLDKDVITCATPIWKSGPWWNGFMFNEQKKMYAPIAPGQAQGMVKVDAVGFGCVAIARRVIEAIQPAPFRALYKEDGTLDRGHDIVFSERARAAGFDLFIHFGYPCQHWSEIDLHDLMQMFKPASQIVTAPSMGAALKAVGSDRRLFDGKQ